MGTELTFTVVHFGSGSRLALDRDGDTAFNFNEVIAGSDPADPTKALCVDMLAPEGCGEIIGGSQRIHDHDLLLARIREHGLPEASFRWYLDIRKYGTVPHAGFGMGIERFVTWMAGIQHLRQAIPYPRQIHRIYP